MPFLADLYGPPNRFINIKIHEKEVYCSHCKGLIGMQHKFDDDTLIRNFRLVRIDPRYLMSTCVGVLRDQNGNLIHHQHTSSVATVESEPTAPVIPLELRSIQNGLFLAEPCVYAKHIIDSPAITTLDRNLLSVELGGAVEVCCNENVNKKHKRALKPKLKTYGKASKKAVEAPKKRKAEEQEYMSDAAFAEYLRDQPSTSRETYDEAIEKAIADRNRHRSNDDSALAKNHTYSKRVSTKSIYLDSVCICGSF